MTTCKTRGGEEIIAEQLKIPKDPAVKVKPESTKGYKPQIQSENNMAAALKTRDL